MVCPWTCKTMNTYHLIDTSQFNKDAKWHKSCHPNNANEPNCTTALSLFIVFLERGVFSSLDPFGTWWCVLVVMCFRGLSGVWSWSEMPGSVSQPWFCSKFLFFFVWFLRSDDAPHPLWLLCLCIRSCFIPHSYVWSCTARSWIFKRMVRCASLCVFARVRSCVCAMSLLSLFIRRFAFGCVVHSVLHLMSMCFRVDWLLLHCSVSVFSSSSSFFFCMICIRLGGLPNLCFFGFVLFCFDWSLAA